MRPFSIYLHVPFCYHKCPYCDFNTYAVTNPPEKDYVAALLSEIDYYASLPEWKGRSVQTIYFGGGTPSILNPKYIKQIIGGISDKFSILPFAEVTLEANPVGVSNDHLLLWNESGVNRLSFGAQSFQSHVLSTLGRTHTSDQIKSSIISAKNCGFKNISLDLIVGVPGQSIIDVRNDVENFLDLEIPHISVYALTIEKGTPFFQSVKRGILKPLSEGITLEMLELIEKNLGLDGIFRYEISNYSKPNYESRHNLAYWNQDDYLGFGAGAHSYLKVIDSKLYGKRWSNFALPSQYINSCITNGQAVSWSESLSLKSAIFEFFMLGLRKTSGISVTKFKETFGITIDKCYGDLIEILQSENLLELEGDFMHLSIKGINLSDSVISNFAEPNL